MPAPTVKVFLTPWITTDPKRREFGIYAALLAIAALLLTLAVVNGDSTVLRIGVIVVQLICLWLWSWISRPRSRHRAMGT